MLEQIVDKEAPKTKFYDIMDFLIKKTDHYMTKALLNGLMVVFLFIVSSDLPGQKSTQLVQSSNLETIYMQLGSLSDSTFQATERFQKKGFIKGRITQFSANAPVCYADIFNINKTSFTKSNSKGEFILGPLEFPASLKIRKFGFKDETIIINNPVGSVLISLAPLEVHKSYSGNKKLLQYELIFKKALEKFRANGNSDSQDHSQRELVYCRISSSIDSTVNSLFESYAQMNVCKSSLQDFQPLISRYASTRDYIPGFSENILEFKIDPFISLPMFIEHYIIRSGYFVQDSSQIALVGVDLGETKNVYYINLADTSIVHITSQFRSKLKNPIQGPLSASQANKSSSTEISFSCGIENRDLYHIDYISENENFRLLQKNKPDQTISKSTFFAIVPDSSQIYDAVRDHVSHETLTESKQQINFNAKFLLSGKSTEFNSEKENLLLKPYKHDFWIINSYVTPDFKERKQIQNWENDSRFYSENRLSSSNEIIGVDSLVKTMNNDIVAVENVYVETDRPDYVAGDTIWFSAFVLDNLHMDSTSLSKILYVDLINPDNKLESHLKLIIWNGRSRGNFSLNKDAKNGIYRLRAYTQYMRNFQSEYLFEKDLPVQQSNLKNLIVVNPVINKSIDGDSVELHIKTILPDEYKTQEKQLEVLVRLNDTLSVRKTFNFKQDLNGSMGFYVPSSLACSFADINLTLSDWAVISTQRISLQLKSGINLQFFPESGKMVDRIETLIAYKAVDTKGKATKFNADIIDENQNKVVHINSDETGVGKFGFTPQFNHSYKALLNLSGNKYIFNLPVTEPKGYVLNFNADSSDILIKNNQNNFKSRHYLLVSVRGVVYASIETKLDNNTLSIHLPLKMYPKGIVQITLFDSLFRPLAERLVFNNRPDKKMLIHVDTDKKVYGQRERVNLTINVTDAVGSPVASSLSMTVVDIAKSDSIINFANIESYLYLTSELKGKVDCKLLNLADTTTSGNRNIDLIMMTQGWRNFLWNSIRYTKTLTVLYPIEKSFYVDGAVYDYNKRTLGSDFRLDYFDLKTGLNGAVKIGEDSRFRIEIPFFYDSHVLFIQNRNNKERISKLGFILDTVPVPTISYRNNELPYVSYNAAVRPINKQSDEIDPTNGRYKKYINIPEVKITAKSDHTGYSAPDKMIDLEKKDPTGKKYSSLFQMIYEEFGEKAFTATGFGTHGKTYSPILVVDGAPLTVSECPPCYDFNAYAWAEAIPVKEISDVKFYEAGSKYSQWLTPRPKLELVMKKGLYIPPPDPQIYLPVVLLKTYSKSYRGNPKGAIMFPYQGIYMAREFYQPDYENNDNKIPDNRTTIYWNPEIQTDSTGKANVSFYNSDLKGEALIRISGVSYSLKDASSTISHYLSH
jgi:hypothetical protein